MHESTSSTLASSSRKSSMQPEPLCGTDSDPQYFHPVGIFVGGIPRKCSQDKLTQFMSQFGYVKEVYISKDGSKNGHKGFAFAKFYSVSRMDLLFGTHKFLDKEIEVKRSLQEYLVLTDVPVHARESDILKTFSDLGYRISEVLVGGIAPGVPVGIVGIRLLKFHLQEQAYKMGSVVVLGKRVKLMLHIRKPKHVQCLGNQSDELQLRARQRSKTEQANLEVMYSNDLRNSACFSPKGGSSVEENALSASNTEYSPHMQLPITGGNSPLSSMKANKSDFMDFESHSQSSNFGILTQRRNMQKRVISPTRTLFSPESEHFIQDRHSSPNLRLPVMEVVHDYIETPRFVHIAKKEIVISFYAFPGHL